MGKLTQPQPKPLVRFRTNGGGVFVHTSDGWIKADAEMMTTVMKLLHYMTRFN